MTEQEPGKSKQVRASSISGSLTGPTPALPQSMPMSSSAATAGRCAALPSMRDASRGLSVSALSRTSADSAAASDQLRGASCQAALRLGRWQVVFFDLCEILMCRYLSAGRLFSSLYY